MEAVTILSGAFELVPILDEIVNELFSLMLYVAPNPIVGRVVDGFTFCEFSLSAVWYLCAKLKLRDTL